jgi:hypothetical protein
MQETDKTPQIDGPRCSPIVGDIPCSRRLSAAVAFSGFGLEPRCGVRQHCHSRESGSVSVDNFAVIDIVSIDKRTGDAILTVSDHLDWSDSIHHQKILQTKLNAYLDFVENGEILKRYPDAAGRSIVFSVVFKFRPDRAGREFLAKSQKVIESAGFCLRYEMFADSYDN